MGTRRRRPKAKGNGEGNGDENPNLGRIMNEQAGLDREDAVTQVLNSGLEDAVRPSFEELAASLKLALKTKDLEEKRHQLERVSELATSIREDCNRLRRETGPQMKALD